MPRKGKDPEFKPFWEADPPKRHAAKAPPKTDQSTTAAAKPALKSGVPKDAGQTAATASPSAAVRAPAKPARPARPPQAGTDGPRRAAPGRP